MEDENIKKARQAERMMRLQEKAKEFQEQTIQLQQKIYSGNYHGLKIEMKGNREITKVEIDQTLYETGSKQKLETAILNCIANLNTAIEYDFSQLEKEMKSELEKLQMENVEY